MNIQWFPGHMTKTKRMIADSIKLCDCVIELCDARCPESSRNPELPKLIGGKKLLLVINKSDIKKCNLQICRLHFLFYIVLILRLRTP